MGYVEDDFLQKQREDDDLEHFAVHDVESVVNEGRKYAIDAAIVRTMKMRKVMMHNELVMEVISQLVSCRCRGLSAHHLTGCVRRRTRCSSPTLASFANASRS